MASQLDQLERRAQAVRGQLALDLDELFLRLRPRRMVRDIADFARETPPEAGRAVVREIRHNPIPYLLIAIGVAGAAWAVASRNRVQGRPLPVPADVRASAFAPPAPTGIRTGSGAPPYPVSPVTRPERETRGVATTVE